jgi:predicted ATPase
MITRLRVKNYLSLQDVNMELGPRNNVLVGPNMYDDNLASWLLTLQTSHPEEFHLLQQAATDVFPDLESILTPLTQFATALW